VIKINRVAERQHADRGEGLEAGELTGTCDDETHKKVEA